MLAGPELQPFDIDDDNLSIDDDNSEVRCTETHSSENMESNVETNDRILDVSNEMQNVPNDLDVRNISDDRNNFNMLDNDDSSNVPDNLSNIPESSDDDNISRSSSENFEKWNEEINEIRDWSVDYSVTQNQLDGLLCILRRRLLPDLPKSAKTFLETCKAYYKIEEMNDIQNNKGEFVYFGIAQGLKACFNKSIHVGNTIELIVNFDGMPLSKSGYREFWPILMKIHSITDIYEQFIVGIFCGTSKPQIEEYLNKFINDLNEHFKNGIEILGKNYKILLKCIVCDTPARSFIKCTQGHNGKSACERCTTKGITKELLNGVMVKLGTTVYPDANSTQRTDKSFRNRKDKNHHNSVSPFTRLIPKIDMIKIFILDSMHLFFLGVMKKLLEFWLEFWLRKELGRRMEYITKQICLEFQRQPRSTQYHKWKATEFRFFALYCGPIVLRGLLDQKYYSHFLLFHVASRLLHSEELCVIYKNHAKKYLNRFFKVLKKFYGTKSQTINAHNLLHVADDVENMQCSLNNISSFPFENLLGKIKRRLLRTLHRPLAQLCRRLHEKNLRNKCKRTVLPTILEILKFRQGEIQEIKYKGSIISVHSPNNVVLLGDKTIFEIEKIAKSNSNDELQLTGKIWKKKESLFLDPIDSASLFMFQLWNRPSRDVRNFMLSSVTKKMVMFKMNEESNKPENVYVIPLLHD